MGRATAVLRALLPPIVVTATRPIRRRVRMLLRRDAPDLRLRDGVVELRTLRDDDRETIERAARDPEIRRRFGLLGARPGEYFTRFRDGSSGNTVAFAICAVGGGCQGLVTVERRQAGCADVGYWLLPEGRGRGKATRALRLVSRWALEQPGIERLQLWTAPDNTASQRVAERSGFRREGILRSYQELEGRREDAVFYSLLPGDIPESEDAATNKDAAHREARRRAARHMLGGAITLV